jgi:hypothetical protein
MHTVSELHSFESHEFEKDTGTYHTTPPTSLGTRSATGGPQLVNLAGQPQDSQKTLSPARLTPASLFVLSPMDNAEERQISKIPRPPAPLVLDSSTSSIFHNIAASPHVLARLARLAQAATGLLMCYPPSLFCSPTSSATLNLMLLFAVMGIS